MVTVTVYVLNNGLRPSGMTICAGPVLLSANATAGVGVVVGVAVVVVEPVALVLVLVVASVVVAVVVEGSADVVDVVVLPRRRQLDIEHAGGVNVRYGSVKHGRGGAPRAEAQRRHRDGVVDNVTGAQRRQRRNAHKHEH